MRKKAWRTFLMFSSMLKAWKLNFVTETIKTLFEKFVTNKFCFIFFVKNWLTIQWFSSRTFLQSDNRPVKYRPNEAIFNLYLYHCHKTIRKWIFLYSKIDFDDTISIKKAHNVMNYSNLPRPLLHSNLHDSNISPEF